MLERPFANAPHNVHSYSTSNPSHCTPSNGLPACSVPSRAFVVRRLAGYPTAGGHAPAERRPGASPGSPGTGSCPAGSTRSRPSPAVPARPLVRFLPLLPLLLHCTGPDGYGLPGRHSTVCLLKRIPSPELRSHSAPRHWMPVCLAFCLLPGDAACLCDVLPLLGSTCASPPYPRPPVVAVWWSHCLKPPCPELRVRFLLWSTPSLRLFWSPSYATAPPYPCIPLPCCGRMGPTLLGTGAAVGVRFPRGGCARRVGPGRRRRHREPRPRPVRSAPSPSTNGASRGEPLQDGYGILETSTPKLLFSQGI